VGARTATNFGEKVAAGRAVADSDRSGVRAPWAPRFFRFKNDPTRIVLLLSANVDSNRDSDPPRKQVRQLVVVPIEVVDTERVLESAVGV
jgi:hypothetical protein